MLKRIIPLVAVVAVLISVFALPAYAAETVQNEILDYRDFASNIEDSDGNSFVSVSVPRKYCSVYCKTSAGQSYVRNNVFGSVSFPYQTDAYASIKFCFPGTRYSEPRYYFSTDNIKDGTPLHLITDFALEPSFEGEYDLKVFYQVSYYNEYFSNTVVLPTKPKSISFENCSGRFEGTYESERFGDSTFSVPDNAKYFVVSLVCQVSNINLFDADAVESEPLSISFSFSDWSLNLMTGETLDVVSQGISSDIGSFFSSSMGWLGDVASLIADNAPLLIVTVGVFACGFVLLIVSRVKS